MCLTTKYYKTMNIKILLSKKTLLFLGAIVVFFIFFVFISSVPFDRLARDKDVGYSSQYNTPNILIINNEKDLNDFQSLFNLGENHKNRSVLVSKLNSVDYGNYFSVIIIGDGNNYNSDLHVNVVTCRSGNIDVYVSQNSLPVFGGPSFVKYPYEAISIARNNWCKGDVRFRLIYYGFYTIREKLHSIN